ncbi:hypothetical protein [Phyllobacterium salinisoli]|uniref:hypothetical protein n=1 Tax=Phyllobacterium salinisoli TaxID=1899321 RepID=UPI001FE07B38|nr:hypothetical protein [Phyllobacterium salinisoli]
MDHVGLTTRIDPREITGLGKPVSMFDPFQDLETFDAARHLGALHPAQQCFVVENLAGADDSAAQEVACGGFCRG